jgi:hypothetical protein
MPLTSEAREPVAAAVGHALARLAGTDAAPPPAAVPAPVVPLPRAAADDDATVDIPALYRELRMLADTPAAPHARQAQGLQMAERAAG